MTERHRRLQESARILRSRLRHLSGREVAPHERAIHAVAVEAVRNSLTEVGRQLVRACV